MRILGERSLVSMLKVIVDIAYYGALGLLGLIVVATIVVAALKSENSSVQLSARFDIDPSAYEITAVQGEAG